MPSACCGEYHTITLSNNGTLHSFGHNEYGQLGLIHNKNVSLPSRISSLPKIKQVSCGAYFTFCIDYEGFLWSFGFNIYGQLGTGNKTNFNVPQKILEIPPVLSVSCGGSHTLIITNDSNLWGSGYNEYGQLFLKNKEHQSKFLQTSFSNISKISAGGRHSLFQNTKGEIFACGHNNSGQCGLGHFNDPQITPSPILNLPENIVQFCCGYEQSYFLDCDGNVYSVGYNSHGNLGLGHKTKLHTLKKIPNIPPIQFISSIRYSCYLLDFDGNVWSFGYNTQGELGHGDSKHRNVPAITSLKNIRQLSNGSCALHFLAKDSQNKIFVTGYNENGQLGTGDTQSCSIPKEINAKYYHKYQIWGNEKIINEWRHMLSSTLKMNWGEEEIETLETMQSKIQKVKFTVESNNNKIKQEFPQNSFESWNEVDTFLNEKLKQINSKMNEKPDIELQNKKTVQRFKKELKDIENEVQRLQSRKKEIEEILLPKLKQSQKSFEETFKEMEKNQQTLEEMCSDVSIFCKNEKEMNEELVKLYSKKKFEEFDCSDISKLLWKMDLTKYQKLFEDNQINGLIVSAMDDDSFWEQLGVEKLDCFHISFHFKMMKSTGYSKIFSPGYNHDCCVCSHNTPKKTVHLLQEYDIPIEEDVILENNYCSSILISKSLKEILGKDFCSQKGIQTILKLDEWKKSHKRHLKDLKKKT